MTYPFRLNQHQSTDFCRLNSYVVLFDCTGAGLFIIVVLFTCTGVGFVVFVVVVDEQPLATIAITKIRVIKSTFLIIYLSPYSIKLISQRMILSGRKSYLITRLTIWFIPIILIQILFNIFCDYQNSPLIQLAIDYNQFKTQKIIKSLFK
jgi:hypothetical protein